MKPKRRWRWRRHHHVFPSLFELMPFCLRESSSLRQMTPWWKPNQVVSVSGCDTYDLPLAGDGWCLIASLPFFRNRFDKFFVLLPWFPTPSHMVALWWLLLGQFSQETRAFAALLIRRRARPRITSTGRVAVVLAGWVSWWFWIAPNVLCHSAADDTSEAYRYGYGKAGIVVTEASKIIQTSTKEAGQNLFADWWFDMSHAVRPCTEKCRPASVVGNSDHSGAHCYLLILGTSYIQRIERNQGFTVVIKSLKCCIFFLILLYFLKICWVGWGGWC